MARLKVLQYLKLCIWFRLARSPFFLYQQGFSGDTCEQASLTFGKYIKFLPYALSRDSMVKCVCVFPCVRVCVHAI